MGMASERVVSLTPGDELASCRKEERLLLTGSLKGHGQCGYLRLGYHTACGVDEGRSGGSCVGAQTLEGDAGMILQQRVTGLLLLIHDFEWTQHGVTADATGRTVFLVVVLVHVAE